LHLLKMVDLCGDDQSYAPPPLHLLRYLLLRKCCWSGCCLRSSRSRHVWWCQPSEDGSGFYLLSLSLIPRSSEGVAVVIVVVVVTVVTVVVVTVVVVVAVLVIVVVVVVVNMCGRIESGHSRQTRGFNHIHKEMYMRII
jgi:hypothetical protein